MGTKPKTRKEKGVTVSEKVFRHFNNRLGMLEARVRHLEGIKDGLPAMPGKLPSGNYPAAETARVLIARQIIQRRWAAGWTQEDLAKRAGVRQETISRLETGKHSPNVATLDKIERAFQKARA